MLKNLLASLAGQSLKQLLFSTLLTPSPGSKSFLDVSLPQLLLQLDKLKKLLDPEGHLSLQASIEPSPARLPTIAKGRSVATIKL